MKALLKTSLFFIITFGITPPSYAENMSGLDTPNMREMIAQMNQMQECLMHIDEIALLKYQTKLSDISNELNDLCRIGKHDEAQNKAIAFSQKMANSKTAMQAHSCTNEMEQRNFMPVPPNFIDLKNHNICDVISPK